MRTLLVCASMFLFLAACGYKGPLVLPKAPTGHHAAKPAASAPQAAVPAAASAAR